MLSREFATRGGLNEQVLSDLETKARDRRNADIEFPTLGQHPLCHP
ncbi:hypothetical protein GA0061101_10415 [Rhizobium lusitanum]|uniref:Uncharacterized protein n=1 Tax=Rhizobium lusitanum TaxID=293958 RepID=A0A1C3V0Q7_9HYPH|nr:hypothetical protein GA0061101_10415 [Rhizobium lusitanum]